MFKIDKYKAYTTDIKIEWEGNTYFVPRSTIEKVEYFTIPDGRVLKILGFKVVDDDVTYLLEEHIRTHLILEPKIEVE